MRELNSTLVSASLAALALSAAPAAAQERWTDPSFMAAANVTVHRGSGDGAMALNRHHRGDPSRHHGRRGRDRDNGFFASGWGWYDPDLNRSWDSDSYNDWWHDRPDRAYPRWVQRNEGCDESRMWQGGGSWRCSW